MILIAAKDEVERAEDQGLNPRSATSQLFFWGFPGGLDDKESTCNAGDLGSNPGLGRSPGKENGYPLQYSGLENSMNRGAWQATVHGVPNSQT